MYAVKGLVWSSRISGLTNDFNASFIFNLFRNDKLYISVRVKVRKLKELEQNELQICNKIRELIDQVPDVEGQILRSRYINCDVWEQIAEQLYFSTQHVQRLHKKALDELQNICEHIHNNWIASRPLKLRFDGLFLCDRINSQCK